MNSQWAARALHIALSRWGFSDSKPLDKPWDWRVQTDQSFFRLCYRINNKQYQGKWLRVLSPETTRLLWSLKLAVCIKAVFVTENLRYIFLSSYGHLLDHPELYVCPTSIKYTTKGGVERTKSVERTPQMLLLGRPVGTLEKGMDKNSHPQPIPHGFAKWNSPNGYSC